MAHFIKHRRRVVVGSSDWHCGSTIGLMPESFRLNDGQIVHPSEEQEWLLEKWHVVRDSVREIAGKAPVVGITNGDLTENLHHATTQLWSYRRDEHEECAYQMARMWDFVDDWRVVRGTPSHVAEGAQMEERIAKRLGVPQGRQGAHTHYNYWGEFSGVRMQWAHYRGGSHRPWTQGNPMRVAVLRMAYHCFEHDIEPPHLIFRSHQHDQDDTYHKYSAKIRGISLGAWQLKTEFVRSIDPDEILADIHAVVIECEAGEYEVHHLGPFELPPAIMPQYERWDDG